MSETLNQMWTQISETVVAFAPNLLGALAILILGWIIAMVVSKVVRTSLDKIQATVSRSVAGEGQEAMGDVPHIAGQITFYFLMLLVLVAFFQTLGLTLITEPLNELLSNVLAYAPQVVGAAVLVFLAWVTARIVRFIVSRASRGLKLDERLGEKMGDGPTGKVSDSLGDVSYWLVFLLFLPGILQTLELGGLLTPVQEITTELFAFLPNLLAAAVILFAGWLVAKVVQRVVTGLLVSAGLDRFAQRAQINQIVGRTGLSGIVGYVLYFLILIPVLISALGALELDSVTGPANQMLGMTLGALPLVFAAGVLLVVSYMVGRFLSSIVVNLIDRVGVNDLLGKLGFPHQSPETGRAVSRAVGTVVFAGVMLFAAIEAFGLLNFENLADLLSEFMVFLSQVALGLFVLAVGLIFANLAHKLILQSGADYAKTLAFAARTAVIVLAASMALRQMGLAEEIVTLAFAFLLGAIAVAAAIAFGLGGREAAAKQISEWRSHLQGDRS